MAGFQIRRVSRGDPDDWKRMQRSGLAFVRSGYTFAGTRWSHGDACGAITPSRFGRRRKEERARSADRPRAVRHWRSWGHAGKKAWLGQAVHWERLPGPRFSKENRDLLVVIPVIRSERISAASQKAEAAKRLASRTSVSDRLREHRLVQHRSCSTCWLTWRGRGLWQVEQAGKSKKGRGTRLSLRYRGGVVCVHRRRTVAQANTVHRCAVKSVKPLSSSVYSVPRSLLQALFSKIESGWNRRRCLRSISGRDRWS